MCENVLLIFLCAWGFNIYTSVQHFFLFFLSEAFSYDSSSRLIDTKKESFFICLIMRIKIFFHFYGTNSIEIQFILFNLQFTRFYALFMVSKIDRKHQDWNVRRNVKNFPLQFNFGSENGFWRFSLFFPNTQGQAFHPCWIAQKFKYWIEIGKGANSFSNKIYKAVYHECKKL